jgi:hypothetical protein
MACAPTTIGNRMEDVPHPPHGFRTHRETMAPKQRVVRYRKCTVIPKGDNIPTRELGIYCEPIIGWHSGARVPNDV